MEYNKQKRFYQLGWITQEGEAAYEEVFAGCRDVGMDCVANNADW